MAMFMVQGKNNNASWAARIYNPRQGRGELLQKVWKGIDAKVLVDYFTLGQYDFLIIVDVPDQSSAAALARAMVASGMLSEDPLVTPILSPEEHRASLAKAKTFKYPPPWEEKA